jgi:hypothetical protein
MKEYKSFAISPKDYSEPRGELDPILLPTKLA